MGAAKPSASIFSQKLDRAAFTAYFLGAIVPLIALAFVVERYVLPSRERARARLAASRRSSPRSRCSRAAPSWCCARSRAVRCCGWIATTIASPRCSRLRAASPRPSMAATRPSPPCVRRSRSPRRAPPSCWFPARAGDRRGCSSRREPTPRSSTKCTRKRSTKWPSWCCARAVPRSRGRATGSPPAPASRCRGIRPRSAPWW